MENAVTKAEGLRPASGQSRKVLINQGVIDRAVKAQQVDKEPARSVLADTACPGLRLVLNPGGSSAWTYAYRPRGRDADGRRMPQRTMAMGDLTTLTPAEARTAAEAVKAAVRNGKDPAPERKAAIEAERLSRLRKVTVATAVDQYKSAALSDGKIHHEHEASHLALAVAEMDVADTPLTSLQTADLYRLLDHHLGHLGVQRHRFGAVSRCLDWHVARGGLALTPCNLIPRKDRPKRPKARQRWLLSLRRRGVSVLFIHHAGKGGQQRGTSRREDILDTVIALRRPHDYSPKEGARFEVHLEKARGLYGSPGLS